VDRDLVLEEWLNDLWRDGLELVATNTDFYIFRQDNMPTKEEVREGERAVTNPMSEMPANRKTDAQIAEMIGCSVVWAKLPWLKSDDLFPFCACEFSEHRCRQHHGHGIPGLLAFFSRDIGAADLVIDWLHDHRLLVTVRDDQSALVVWCDIHKPGFGRPKAQRFVTQAFAGTRALAICRAALSVPEEALND